MSSEEMTVVFPCRVGDEAYSFEWNPKDARYAIVQSKCLGFNIRSAEGFDIVLKSGQFEYLRNSAQYRENWFTDRDEAQKRLEMLNAGEDTARPSSQARPNPPET